MSIFSISDMMINRCITIYSLVAALTAGAIPAASAQKDAGTSLPGSLDFLNVTDVRLFTSYVIEDGYPVAWGGDGFHAGIQAFSFILSNCKEIPREFDMPTDPSSFLTITDLEGRMVASDQRDETPTFRKLKYTSSFKTSPSFSLGVTRGGEYLLRGGIDPDLYVYEQKVVLNDEPAARVTGTNVRITDGLNPLVTVTSGYPYDPDAVSGEHTLHWSVASTADPSAIIADNTESFELKSDIRTLAAIAELQLKVPDITPGEYIFTLTSDYGPANRTFIAKVNDVLHAEVNIVMSEYIFGEDLEASLKMDLGYGYPFVAIDDATGQPTVTVTATLLSRSASEQFSDPAWVDSEMQLSKDIRIPFDDVTVETLREYDGRLPLDVSVYFNGQTQYSQTFDLLFRYDSTGIPGITTDSTDRPIKLYDINGIEVDAGYHGLVITSDGTRLLRR